MAQITPDGPLLPSISFVVSTVMVPVGRVIQPSLATYPPPPIPTVAGILHGSAATGDGLGDGEGEALPAAEADALGDEVAAADELPHAVSRRTAMSAVQRMRGTIAPAGAVFAILAACPAS